jgi:hypothetical protein
MIYLLDTNIFISAHRMHYPLDVVVSFWDKLQELGSAGQIISIDKVKNEIFRNEDTLKAWCMASLAPDFFKESQPCISAYTQIVRWANSSGRHYQERAINEFMDADNADAWLVAYAMENQNKIVPYEKSNPNKQNRIKIPEAFNAFSIPFVDPIGMFRELGVRI